MPEARTLRLPNKRGERTRGELVDAGWRIVDRMGLGELLACLTPSDVAREAGRTTGAFFHHFTSLEPFIDAMVGQFAREFDFDRMDIIMKVGERARESPRGELVRELATAEWEIVTGDQRHRTMFRRLFLLTAAAEFRDEGSGSRGAPMGTDGSERAGRTDVVRASAWDDIVESMVPHLEAFWAATGRTVMPPFTFEEVALLNVALELGLIAASAVGTPIDTGLLGRASVVLTSGLTTPIAHSVTLGDLDAAIEPAGDPASRAELEVILDRGNLEAIRSLAGQYGSDIRMSGIADSCGVSAAVAAQMFGSTRRACALTVRLELPEAIAATERFRHIDSARSLFEGLMILTRAARENPVCAAAFLAEMLLEQDVAELRRLVPVEDALRPSFLAAFPSGERPGPDALGIVLDICLHLGASRPSTPVHDVVQCALRSQLVMA